MKTRDPQTWQGIVDRMPVLLHTLRSTDLRSRDDLQGVPERGVYVFYEDEGPVYVGRSDRMRERIQEHGRPSSTRNSANFAFLLAIKDAGEHGIDCNSPREYLEQDSAFVPFFSEAKARVGQMKVRVVELDNAVEQTILEVYAALSLRTTKQDGGYNDFENH